MVIKTSNLLTLILIVVVFLTNITQMPQLIGSGLNSKITLLCWGTCALFLIVTRRIKIGTKNIRAFFALLGLLAITYILETVTGNDYHNIALLYPFMVSVFVFMIGSLMASDYQNLQMKKIYYSYIVSGLIVGISVYFDSFASGFNWTSRGYAYESKNSVAQIILTVVILLVFIEIRGFMLQIVRAAILIFMLLLLFMLKSRASLIGLAVVVIVVLFNKSIKLRYKILLGIGLMFGIYAVCTNAGLYDIVVEGIIFAGRNHRDLNDLSSGRYDMLKEFMEIFPQNAVLGTGLYYLESFPLSVLCQYGIVGSIPFVILLLLPFALFKRMEKTADRRILIVILICYYLNGLFEELAPLGPGVKCYFLWFLLGLESSGNKIERRK